MKVIENVSIEKFHEVEIGDVFYFSNTPYLKIGDFCTAINLKTFYEESFDDNDEVKVVSAKLIIEK